MRRRDREVTDAQEIRRTLDEGKIVRIGMHDGDGIYIVPMNYGYCFADGKLVFYTHGSPEGKKWDLIRRNPNVSFELDCAHALAEGELPCQYSYGYACVMGSGKAELVDDVQEKQKGLSLLMNCQTGREFRFDAELAASVQVMKLTAAAYTCKRHSVDRGWTEENGGK